MASQKSYEERIQDLIRRQDELKAQEKALRQKASSEERKKRTRRLIELGGIVESVLGRATTDDDKIKFKAFLDRQERNGNYFSRAMNAAGQNKD